MTDSPGTLPAALRAAATAHPGDWAVVDGDIRVTYAELGELSRRAGGAFVAAGIGKGDPVAIWAPNSLDWIVAYLGLSSAGAMLVPLNTRFQGREAADLLRRSRARLLLTVDTFLGRSYTDLLAGEDLPHLEATVRFGEEWEKFLDSADSPSMSEVDDRVAALGPDDWLDLMFTSGTTGAPKGVRTRHGANVRSFRYYADNLGIVRGDRYLLVNPLFHSFGAKAGVLASILAGATVYPVPTFDPRAAAELISREQITVFPGPPTIYHALLDLPPTERSEQLRSLRLAVTGAATVPVELLRRMSIELGFDIVLTAYGMTEACGLVTMCRAGDSLEVVSATSGRPIPGVEVSTVDSDGKSTPSGEPGEVVVRGYPVFDGYFEDPAATAEAIDDEGWFHTGDIGVVDEDGGLRITDRLKDMYIHGGFNVYPGEVESALLELTSIGQVAVVGIPDEHFGEVGVAYVVPRPGEPVLPEQVVEYARGRLANFKVPRRVAVVDELPVNASGKVLKHLLRERAAEGSSGTS